MNRPTASRPFLFSFLRYLVLREAMVSGPRAAFVSSRWEALVSRFFRVSLSLSAIVLLGLSSCKSDQSGTKVYRQFKGETMGTTYNIVYDAESKASQEVSKTAIDDILAEINLSLSTYIDSSTVSKINNSETYGQEVEILVNGAYEYTDKLDLPIDLHFVKNYKKAKEYYYTTDGAFDPTVMPLVNYWGFGYTPKNPITAIDSQKVHELLQNIGLDKWQFDFNVAEINPEDKNDVVGNMAIIKDRSAELDFSAIAKGYAVDEIAKYLDEAEVMNYMVEIGGEVYAKGLSTKGQNWIIGLNTPKVDAALTDFAAYVGIDDWGLASSGNYRQYHEVDGQRYSHEINPKTGFPEKNTLLAVSVIAPTCMDADVLATACMVMGKERAMRYINNDKHTHAIMFYSDSLGQIKTIKSDSYFLFDVFSEEQAE